MRIAELRKRLAKGAVPTILTLATVALLPAAAQATVPQGHPELYVNNIKAEGETKPTTQVGYGQIELESAQLPGGEIECVNLGFGTGYNAGTPLRAHGQILAWSSAGHVNTGKTRAKLQTENITSAQCLGLGGKAWATDERAIQPITEKEAKHGALTTPWNVEVACGEREEEQAGIIRVGVPTTQTAEEKAANEKRVCVDEEEEKELIANEITKKEGCYKSNPSPAGCIGVDIIDPSIGIEITYGGTLRAKGKNGAGNGLSQSLWIFEGAASGELQCQNSGCAAKGVTFGEVKEQGLQSVQLITNK